MSLVSLEIYNIRIYEHARFVLDRHLNIITGANASGKTTLLEAIHLLGTGRSFRTAQIDQLKRNDSTDPQVAGLVDTINQSPVRLGFVHSNNGKRVSVNGQEQRRVSSLAQHLPLHILSPDAHYEFQNSPQHRRGVLDWCLFHVEQDFPKLWARYQRILLQRNAALKDRSRPKARYAWDEDLAKTGELINTYRLNLIEQLLPHFQSCSQEIFGAENSVELVFEPGWDGKNGLAEDLHRDLGRDRARGFTHCGPQRADLRINLNSRASKASASHGQYKLLVIALRLAQIQFLFEAKGQHCCLLIDDLAAELDSEHRSRLTKMLAGFPAQVIVTATESSLIDRKFWPSCKMFHVKHGVVSETP